MRTAIKQIKLISIFKKIRWSILNSNDVEALVILEDYINLQREENKASKVNDNSP